jgi:hypothetical protein
MRSNKRKKEPIKSEPHPGHSSDVQGEPDPKTPPSIVDGKVGTEGWGPGTITDKIVDEAEDPAEAQPE